MKRQQLPLFRFPTNHLTLHRHEVCSQQSGRRAGEGFVFTPKTTEYTLYIRVFLPEKSLHPFTHSPFYTQNQSFPCEHLKIQPFTRTPKV